MSQKVIPPIHWALSISYKPMLSLLLLPRVTLKTMETGLFVCPPLVCFASFTNMEVESQQIDRCLFTDVGKQLEQLRTQALSPCLPGCQRSKSTKNCVDFSVQSHPSMSIPQKKGICYSCSVELSPFLTHYFQTSLGFFLPEHFKCNQTNRSHGNPLIVASPCPSFGGSIDCVPARCENSFSTTCIR